MTIIHLIFGTLAALAALANLVVIFKCGLKFPMTILVNGMTMIICILAALFNFAQL